MRKFSRQFFPLLLSVLLAACVAPSAKKTSSVPLATKADSPLIEAPKTEEPSLPEPPSQAPKADQSSQENAKKTVRVLLTDNQTSTEIKHSGRVYIYTQDLSKKYKVSTAGTLAVKALENGRVQVGTLQTNQPIILEPAKDTLFTWDKNLYAGKFFIIPATHTFYIVEHVDLENYLYGVLPYEMSYSWPLEALKAQAVAARTYTLKTIENVKNKSFDLYSDVRSQMYKGGGKQYDSVKQAVDATRSQVLTYDGNLFYTYYHGNCGGGTDDVRSWNPTASTIKPLSGASCSTDSHSKSYSWKMNISTAKVMEYAKTVGLKGNLKGLSIAKKTGTGRATNLTIRSSSGIKQVPCGKFRLATGIRSCKITKISVLGQTVHFEGKGYGHGIGMCQDGANGMAKNKKDYKQILKHYYPGSKITEIN